MKQRHFKALTSLLLVVVMLASLLPAIPVTVTAADGTWTLVKDASTLAAGDRVIIAAKDSAFALSTTQNGNNRGQAAITKSGDTLVNVSSSVQILTLETGTTSGTFAFSTGNGYLYAASSSKNYLRTETKLSANSSWKITIDSSTGAATVKAQGTNSRNQLQYNKSSKIFAAYGSTQQAMVIYKEVTSSGGGSSACEHTNTTVIPAVDATCTTAGKTQGTQCTDCNAVVTAQEPVNALGHNVVDGVCTREGCGYKPFAAGDYTIKITTGSTTYHVGALSSGWVTVATSGTVLQWTISQVAGTDYYTVCYKTNSTTNYLQWTSNSNGIAISSSAGEKCYWIVEEQEDGSVKFISTDKTVRLAANTQYESKIRAYKTTTTGANYIDTFMLEAACSHSETVAIGEAKDATCTEDGITAGSKCADCGETITAQETIPATGHTAPNAEYKCDTCGEKLCTNHVWVDDQVEVEGNCTTDRVVSQKCETCGEPGEDKVTKAPGHTPVTDEAVAPNCTTPGMEEGSHCGVCNAVIKAQTPVAALGHTYEDGVCSKCGAEKPAGFNGVYTITFTKDSSIYAISKYDNKWLTVTTEIDTSSADVQWTISQVENTEYYTLSNNGKFIKWTSGENGIAVVDTADKNCYWTIEVQDNGSVKIFSSDATVRLAANTGSQNKIRAYKATTTGVNYIDALTLTAVSSSAPAPEAPEYKGFNVTLNGGITINVTYDISAEWIEAHPEAKVAFVFADGVELSGSEPVAPTAGTTKYSFTLTPQAIEKQLYIVITEGETEIERYEVSYSIYKESVEDLSGYEGLSDLLDSIDSFTAAANGTLTEDVTADFTDVEAWTPATNGSILKSVNISLGQQITAKIGVDTTIDYTGYKVTVTLGEVALLTEADFTQYITSEGKLVVKGLAPTHLNDQLTVTVYDVDGNEVASTSFNINSYLKTLYETTTGYDKNLAAATFNYGIAAEAYAGK